MRWNIDKHGRWLGAFGLFRAQIYQHQVNGQKWSWSVFDQVSPELYDTRQAAQAGVEAYAWIQLNIAMRALRPR